MIKKITILLLGYYIILLAQPKAFDPDYYKDTLKVKKSGEFKKFENYREKYKSRGFILTRDWGYESDFSEYYAYWFYHHGINLDKINEYNKLGYFKYEYPFEDLTYYDLKFFRQIIVIGELTHFERENFDSDKAIFNIKKIIKGGEYYKSFPNTIKCYSDEKETMLVNKRDNMGNIIGKEPKADFGGRVDPKPGDNFILYLDIFKAEHTNLNRTDDKNEFGRIDVFYDINADYFNEDSIDGKNKLNDLLTKINEIEKLRLKVKD